MMRAPQITQQANRFSRFAALSIAICGLGLAGCDDQGGDPRLQIGANPKLPEPQQYLMPPMKVAKPAVWSKDETPVVSDGLQIHALATGFEHPRQLYVLPNGDVLVVEGNGPRAPIHRPKDIVFHVVQSYAGGGAKGANRITLLRGMNADGTAKQRTVFLDHLNSPFGVALVGHDLYVANTDAIMRYPYTEGETSITAPGTKLTDLPGGPIDHHWTKSLLQALTVPSSMSASVRTATSPRTASAPNTNAPRSGRSTGPPAPIASSPAVSAIRPAWLGARERQALGHRQRTRRARARSGAGLPDLGPGRRLLRLAL